MVIAAGLTLAIFALGWVFGRLDDQLVPRMHQHLGAEYFNIARALADGRGFSDPFAEPTGPTAWMPPLYPILIAGILRVTQSRLLTAEVVLFLTNLSLVFIGTTIYAIARRCRECVSPLFGAGLYIVWIATFRDWMFLLTQDIWLISTLVTFLVILLYRRLALGHANPWAWGSLGGMCASVSPALGLAWLCVLGAFWFRDGSSRRWKLAVAVAVALAIPWTARNALVFHSFIPVKSNLFFDAYQANVVDDDGVHDRSSMQRHPFSNPNVRFDYALQGEPSFMNERRLRFLEWVRRNPTDFFRKVTNRAAAASFRYVPVQLESGGKLLVEQIVYPLPFVAFIVGIVASRGRTARLVGVLALLCLAYLLPYVLVAFYIRYLLPLTPALLLVGYLALDQAWARIKAIAAGWPVFSSRRGQNTL